MIAPIRPARVLLALCALYALAASGGCRQDEQEVRGAARGDVILPGDRTAAIQAADTAGLPDPGIMGRVAVGDIAGPLGNTLATQIVSPYANDMSAIKEGRDLFVGMNCAGCHGYTLRGGMGPDLTDSYWRYGGSPAHIYKSIFEGRPQGMPAWGRTLPPELIWKVVAYIESYGGAFPAALAERGLQGDLGDQDTTSFSTLKGRQNAH